MASLKVRFQSVAGAVLSEKSIPVRNENAISYDTLLDLLYGAGLSEYATRLESGEFAVDGRPARDLTFQGRVDFKSTREEGIGNGASTSVHLQAQGVGSGQIHIPAGSTVAAAFARANIAVPANSTILMNGRQVSLTATIPAGAAVQISAAGAVKGGV